MAGLVPSAEERVRHGCKDNFRVRDRYDRGSPRFQASDSGIGGAVRYMNTDPPRVTSADRTPGRPEFSVHHQLQGNFPTGCRGQPEVDSLQWLVSAGVAITLIRISPSPSILPIWTIAVTRARQHLGRRIPHWPPIGFGYPRARPDLATSTPAFSFANWKRVVTRTAPTTPRWKRAVTRAAPAAPTPTEEAQAIGGHLPRGGPRKTPGFAPSTRPERPQKTRDWPTLTRKSSPPSRNRGWRLPPLRRQSTPRILQSQRGPRRRHPRPGPPQPR
jgi:hypothetical protein